MSDRRAAEAGPLDVPFTLARDEAGEATVFVCALCGDRFTHGGQVCGTCPLVSGCDLVKCPNCGYQFPRSSRLVDWFRALFRKRSRGQP